MKNIIVCDSLYQDIDSLHQIVSSMNFEASQFGSKILDFYYTPKDLDTFFSQITGEFLDIQPETGEFRKPNDFIHVEPFYQHCRWVCIVAMEDTSLTTFNHKEGKTIFDITNALDDFVVSDCVNKKKWDVQTKINMKKNDFVFLRPWLWYTLEQNKLVQVFLLNAKLENKETDA